MPRCSSQSSVVWLPESEPLTDLLISSSSVAKLLIPVPPTPTRWGRRAAASTLASESPPTPEAMRVSRLGTVLSGTPSGAQERAGGPLARRRRSNESRHAQEQPDRDQ